MGATITDPLVGTIVDGRYEVVSRIARGGMATVYLALDRRLDREVALKVMHPHLADGADGTAFVARFRREARSAARLTHPGLVGVYDQGVDGETSYLTMEYVDGITLRRRLGEEGSLTVDEALHVTESVLDALAAAHRHGLVHRDVKPENILIAQDERIKLADFGLARAVTEVTATTTGTVLGTVAYLGPELVSRGVADARTDVYAVGIVLFEMLTGSQPFTGSTPIQVAFQHVNSDTPPPSGRVAWLPQEIDDLVSTLSARDPESRPHDAGGALDLVRRTRAQLDPETLARRADVEPSITLPDATADADDALDPDATEHIALDPAGTTVALPIGVGVVTPEQAAAEEHAALLRSRRRKRWWAALVALLLLGGIAALGWWYVTSGPGAYTRVPDVIGMPQARAETELIRVGLEPVIGTQFSHEPVGDVIATFPEANGQIARGGQVAVTVSRGPDMRDVPEGLVGMDVTDATRALLRAGFDVLDPVLEYHDAAAEGEVLAFSPSEEDQYEVGTEFTLTVSQGPAPVTIISVIGATEEGAREDLENSGLVLVVGEPEFSDTVEEGRVISQSPAPNSPGHRTDEVTVVISKGPELFEIPNLIRLQYEEAAAILEELGMEPRRENVLGGFFGTVRDQSVPEGERVPRGTVITLTVV